MTILTRQLIDEYQNKRREINRLKGKITYYANLTPKSEHGVVTGSMKDFPYKQCHFVISGSNIKDDRAQADKLKSLMITLRQRESELDEFEDLIWAGIAHVENPEARQILEFKIIKGMTDSRIAKEMHCERSTITKKIKKILEI